MAAPRTCGASSRAAKRALLEPCMLAVVGEEVGGRVGRGKEGCRVEGDERDVMLFRVRMEVDLYWLVLAGLDVHGVYVCGGAIGTSKARWTGVD